MVQTTFGGLVNGCQVADSVSDPMIEFSTAQLIDRFRQEIRNFLRACKRKIRCISVENRHPVTTSQTARSPSTLTVTRSRWVMEDTQLFP